MNPDTRPVNLMDLTVNALLGLTLAITWRLARRRLSAGLPLLIFGGALVFSAKHSFLRADWVHMSFFFGLLWSAGVSRLSLRPNVAHRSFVGLWSPRTRPQPQAGRTC